jgi:DNA end-binding protein Ku
LAHFFHGGADDRVRFGGQFAVRHEDKEMVSIATKIMSQKEAKFDPKTFEDRYEDALRDLIKRKRKGQDVVEAAEPEDEESNVIDLMGALQASLKKKGARAKPKPFMLKKANAADAVWHSKGAPK